MTVLYWGVLGIAVGGVFILSMEYSKRARLIPFMVKLGQRTSSTIYSGWGGLGLSGILDGDSISFCYKHKRRLFLLFHQPSSFYVSIPRQIHGDFQITTASDDSPHYPPYGAAPLSHSGNSLFDREYIIYSSQDSFVKSNLKDGEKRQAIRRIFTLGAKWICFDGQHMSAIWEPFEEKGEIAEKTLLETVSRLTILSKNLQPATEENINKGGDLFYFLIAASAIFLATMALSLYLLSYL